MPFRRTRILRLSVRYIRHSNALGASANNAAASGTTVRQRATLELEKPDGGSDLAVLLEALSLTGAGFGTMLANRNHARFADTLSALRNVGGSNSWAGTITLGSDAVFLPELRGGWGMGWINKGVPFIHVAADRFTITGDFGGSDEMAKFGPGTLELAGVIARGQDRNNHIFEGTVLLNNAPGVQVQRGRWYVGSDVAGAAPATLRLGASDQIPDDRRVVVFSSGLFDLNGNSDVIGEDLSLHVGPAGAGAVNIGSGGMLTVNAGTNVYTMGVGNPSGATISDGTFALQVFGTITTAGTRTLQVNDGAVGTDLTITSAIVDGTGLQPVAIVKTGFGTLQLGGTSDNTNTGDTTVNEGTLLLNKGTGSGGVRALSGRLYVGDNTVTSGYSGADVVRWLQPEQLPDYASLVDLRTTWFVDLNGFNETIGNVDGQTGLTLRASSTLDTGGGTLTVNGNLTFNAAEGASLWTPVAPATIRGKLNLGSVVSGIGIGERSELPFDLIIAADIRGTGGINKTNTGTLLLSGNNTYSGDTVLTGGALAAGSNAAFGASRVRLPTTGASLAGVGGARELSNEFYFSGATALGTTINLGGSSTLGGGGNNLKLTGAANLTSGITTLNAPVAATVEFAGGLGEMYAASALNKAGFGTLVFSADSPYSGPTTIAPAGGTIVLTENGTARNTAVTVNPGGVLQVGDFATVANPGDRLGDNIPVTLAGGTLALAGRTGGAATESLSLTLAAGTASTVQSLVRPGSSATTRIGNFLRSPGAFVDFQGQGTDLGDATANRIAFTVAPALTDGILPYAVITNSTGLEFATWENDATPASPAGTPFDNFLTPLTGGPNFSTVPVDDPTVNLKLGAGTYTLPAITVTVNALLVTGAATLDGAVSLTLDRGLLGISGGASTVATTGTLTLPAEAFVHTVTDLTVNSTIAGRTCR